MNIRQLIAGIFKRIGSEIEPSTERDYVVIVADVRGKMVSATETVRASSATQAAELAAGRVSARQLRESAERSWRFTCVVENSKFNVVAQTLIKAEVVP
jgi:hypothetical protein